MNMVGYYNGKIGALEEMQVPMMDRAFYFGDGCYDATMFANNRIFAEEEHFNRFYNSCRKLKIPFAMTRSELHDVLMSIIDANEEDHGFLYWQVSRGTSIRNHPFPGEEIKPNLMAFTIPDELTPMDEHFRLISMEDIRFYLCDAKTLNLLPNVLASQEAASRGCYETVFYRHEFGRTRVTECAHSNVLMIKDGTLIAPPRDNLILPGITLGHLLMLAGQNGIPVQERAFTLEELKNADEVIISSCGSLCIPACELDGQPVGGKDPKTLKTLQQAYDAYFKKYVGLAD